MKELYIYKTLWICLVVEVTGTLSLINFYPKSRIQWMEGLYNAGIIIGILGAVLILFAIWVFYKKIHAHKNNMKEE